MSAVLAAIACMLCLVNARGLAATLLDDAGAQAAARSHWAFQPLVRPEPPAVKKTTWVRNPIDQFVLARLESLGIEPSPEADRTTLARRLSLDLLGLLPTPAEVDQFVNDRAPAAYENFVDKLLRSPHFGERWGRHWLDLARYADSDGYEKDSPRPTAYLYRNWVIDAINRDLPFDRFTIEQLAGDLLPGATLEQKTATGFHRNTLTNREGGVDQEEYRNRANVDRVNTTSTVWLGLTMGCSECHDHKYDPFTQQDYYSLFAFFNRSQELDVPAPQPDEAAAYQKARQAFDAEHGKLESALADFEKSQLETRLANWETALVGKLPSERWVVLKPEQVASSGGATLSPQPDGSIQVGGKSPATDQYTIETETNLVGITALRLEVLPDPKHPAKGPGRVKHGNFVLSEFRVTAAPASTGPETEAQKPTSSPVALQNPTADFSQDKYLVAHAIDGDPATGWAVAPQFGQRHLAVFETKENVGFSGGTRLSFTLDQQYGTEHTIGQFRIAATTAARPVRTDDLPDEIVDILRLAPDRRDEKQRSALLAYYRTIDPEWKKLNGAVAEHAKKAPAPPGTKALTMAINPSPPKTQIHIRGDFLRKGAEVEPGAPALFASLKPRGEAFDRLDLANWLFQPSNPLTARVAINRIWQHLFAKGLVGTPEDFGRRGEKPSHPELLDWLASEFASQGWSRKQMIKLIVSSATYRQSSWTRADLIDRDPNNTLLARQNRYRLESEIVRDIYLAASGLLNQTVGGPSVRPPQPAGIAELTYAGSAKWVESKGADRYRRGMYTWFQRTSPYPMLTTFDSPDGVVCTVRRERSNTPLQALTLLNDTVFVECAQGLARRVIAETPGGDTRQRVRHAVRLCLSRNPSESEVNRLIALHDTLLDQCRASAEDSAKLAGSEVPAGMEAPEAAAWVLMARCIMNLDEFVTRE